MYQSMVNTTKHHIKLFFTKHQRLFDKAVFMRTVISGVNQKCFSQDLTSIRATQLHDCSFIKQHEKSWTNTHTLQPWVNNWLPVLTSGEVWWQFQHKLSYNLWLGVAHPGSRSRPRPDQAVVPLYVWWHAMHSWWLCSAASSTLLWEDCTSCLW